MDEADEAGSEDEAMWVMQAILGRPTKKTSWPDKHSLSQISNQSTLQAPYQSTLPRNALVTPARFLPSTRRFCEALVGLVALRALGT